MRRNARRAGKAGVNSRTRATEMNATTQGMHQHGYSLTELMTVMLVIGVLGLLAYPSYLNVIQQSRRAEARSALHATLLQQERYYTLHNTYFVFDSTTPDSPFKWWSGDSVANSYYEIGATRCPDQSLHECVLLTATPGTGNVRNNADPLCGSLMLDSAGNKTISVSAQPIAACW